MNMKKVLLLGVAAIAMSPFLFSSPPDPPVEQHEGDIPRVGQKGVEAPVFINRVTPDYPLRGGNVCITGYVILEAVFCSSGAIDDIHILRGLGKGKFGYENEAIKALTQYVFQPGRVNGVPADVKMVVKIDFHSPSSGKKKLSILSWEVDQKTFDMEPPEVYLHVWTAENMKELSSISIPLRIDIDSQGYIVDYEILGTALECFRNPYVIETLIEKTLDEMELKPATNNGIPEPTELIIKVEVQLP